MLALVTLLVVVGIIAGVVIYTNLSSGPNENATVKKQEKQETFENGIKETWKGKKKTRKPYQTCTGNPRINLIFITCNKNCWKNLK